ncbi:hypothetical protein AAFF_G00382560 [Aldrovandia affinis]|uniref:Doublecortin domain-containing protein n=1 Tax=Aldrovandia affinis TaxID=143900 RepID=A0AAD7X1R1_9TELE|nr:hypothetical protein AAFF_G00382560 [Aldrovandia affinis]
MGEVDKGCEDDQDLRMKRVIHQRLQARAGYSPVGPRIVPTCLFDERGEAIRSLALLRNEQSTWVSYYRWGAAGGLEPGVLPLLPAAQTR